MGSIGVLLTFAALICVVSALITYVLARRIEARYPPQGRFVAVSGGRLHYVEDGPERAAAGTVVLIHGASSSHGDAMLAIGRLARCYRVIAIDRPGQGWSDRIAGQEAATPARQAAIIAEALRKLDVRDAVILGHSWAGAVVPNLALDHRDVAGAIVILAGVTHPWPSRTISWYYHPAASVLGYVFTRTLTTPLGVLLLEPTVAAVFAPQIPPEGYSRAAFIPLALRPTAFRANAQDVAVLHDAVAAQSARYSQIRVPVVIVAGEEDRIVWTDLHARSFKRDVPGTDLVILPGVGHMPHHSHPDLVIAKIEGLAAAIAAREASPRELEREP
jgi:pimeloyl-ACP methyl ester carboxylesterase